MLIKDDSFCAVQSIRFLRDYIFQIKKAKKNTARSRVASLDAEWMAISIFDASDSEMMEYIMLELC